MQDGMLPPHDCTKCGKPLNADGDHPAELYAGSYTGLCYKCQHSSAYKIVDSPDGSCSQMSHPPHCPSWRRTRELYWWWHDCQNPKCHQGAEGVYRPDSQGGSYVIWCPTCQEAYNALPSTIEAGRQLMRLLASQTYWRERSEAEYNKRLRKAKADPEPTAGPRPIADTLLASLPQRPTDHDAPLPLFPLGWATNKWADKAATEWEALKKEPVQ